MQGEQDADEDIKGRQSEELHRRLPSASQGEKVGAEPSLEPLKGTDPADPLFSDLSLQNQTREDSAVVLSCSFAALGDGSPRKVIHRSPLLQCVFTTSFCKITFACRLYPCLIFTFDWQDFARSLH